MHLYKRGRKTQHPEKTIFCHLGLKLEILSYEIRESYFSSLKL